MALEYSIKITKVRVKKNKDGLKNVIERVFYVLKATDTTDGMSKSAWLEVVFDEVDPINFVDISEITDDSIIIEWIKSHPNYLTAPTEKMFIDMIQFEREKEYIEDYQFPFLYIPNQNEF